MTGAQRRMVNRRSVLLGGLAAAATMGLAACGDDTKTAAAGKSAKATVKPKPDGDLTWFSWADYVAPEVVEGFEKEYGVKVTFDAFDSDDTMLQKLAAGLPYDLVTTNSAYMYRAIQGGLLLPLEISALKNGGEILPYFEKPAYDNGDQLHSVPYSGGPTGIVYRTDQLTGTESWDDLWELGEDGKVFVLDYVEDAIGASLLRLGYDLNSADAAEVEEATNELVALKPRLGGISNDTRNNMSTGNAYIHQAWSTDAYAVMTDGKYADKIAFQQTTEDGVPFGMDLLSIGANAKAPGTAMAMIDWLLRPENQEKNVTYIGQLAGTRTGDEVYRDVVKDIPSLQVPENFYETAQWRDSLEGERLQLWTQSWNRFKAS
ncbi:ABC transporter substrate-binding protein [Nocardioides caldifontis]|uniref:ABC transporter substrate-binding protein n=1 Tax=Nocardioides caldifontis TaxID=2588938 RepID=UPI0011E06CED|nr:spermidine/putrescine ABC transporter substrate-binding protein [Nocardioides caldifontis]